MNMHVTSPWTHEREDLYNILGTNPDGLTAQTAQHRLRTTGKNIIKKQKRIAAFTILWHQAVNPLVGLLYAACIFSLFLGKTPEAIFVGVAIVINIGLGFFQEYKANNAIAKLEKYITEQSRVKRDGRIIYIDTQNLVPGDIIFLKQGDRIGADIRLFHSDNFKTDEAIITGESLPVLKDPKPIVPTTALADRTNMAWAGSVVSEGEAEGVVVATGNNTEIGKIAHAVDEDSNTKTPLEKEVSRLAKIISFVLVLVGILIFGIGLYAGFELDEILLLSIAVIVSAVPGSIPVAMSVVLAVGAETLAQKKGVVRKMSATETLGGTTLILTDKTGTLTEAKLKLVDIDTHNNRNRDEVLIEAALNVDIVIDPDTQEISGRPVEIALTEALRENASLFEISKTYTVIDSFPFSSAYKFSAIFFTKDNKTYVTLLGAPDILTKKTRDYTPDDDTIERKIAAYAQTGERVLGVVTKEISSTYDKQKEVANSDFLYAGLIRFKDPVRKSVPSAVQSMLKAGVSVRIVTGDHPGTAKAIAQEIGLWHGTSSLLTGQDLENMTDFELKEKLEETQVYARMTPTQKLRLVDLYSSTGEIVAVTGDGVNDAPALKHASIGVAMGSGTDVAQASADIVILDNNFETIAQAIFEGRNVLRKMRSVITYLLADSYDELLLVGGSILLALPLPLTALQILFVKFFSDIFPAMGFTSEKTDVFSKTTKPPKTSLFDKKIKIFTLGRGLVSSMFLFSIYIIMLRSSLNEHMVHTFIFASFASYILFLAFSMRNLDEPLLSYKPFSNTWLTVGVGVGFLTIGTAIYYPPLQSMLSTTALPPLWLLGVIGIGIINLIFMEILKKIVR